MARKHMGSLITIRRMRGLGRLSQPSSMLGAAAPPALGVALAGLTTLALRYFVDPAQGTTQAAMFKWAPLIGMAVNGVGSFIMYYLAGAPAAVMSASAGTLAGGVLLAHDKLLEARAAELVSTATPGQNQGLGVVVPQNLRGRMRGILMEPAASQNPYRRYGISGPYGETVNMPGAGVRGINPSAFGTPGH